MKTADQEDVEDRQDDRQAEAGLPPLFGSIFASKYQLPSVFPTGLSTFITSPAAGFTAEKFSRQPGTAWIGVKKNVDHPGNSTMSPPPRNCRTGKRMFMKVSFL